MLQIYWCYVNELIWKQLLQNFKKNYKILLIQFIICVFQFFDVSFSTLYLIFLRCKPSSFLY